MIGKMVRVLPNDQLCPTGEFKVTGIDEYGELELEDPKDLENPWKVSRRYVEEVV